MKSNKSYVYIQERIIEALNSNDFSNWIKKWKDDYRKEQHNFKTKKAYTFINQFILSLSKLVNEYEQNAWLTFSQAKQLKLKIKKGQKAIPLMYYYYYDFESKIKIDISDYNKLDEKEKIKYKMLSNNFNVFNIEQCETIEGEKIISEDNKNSNIISNENVSIFVGNVLKNIKIEVVHEENEAYYNYSLDYINMPDIIQFTNEGDYTKTLLHELGHSTMHKDRLNRKVKEYAIEELIAEFTAVFLSSELECDIENSIENHIAYIGTWKERVKENENVIIDVIFQANKITKYLIENGKE